MERDLSPCPRPRLKSWVHTVLKTVCADVCDACHSSLSSEQLQKDCARCEVPVGLYCRRSPEFEVTLGGRDSSTRLGLPFVGTEDLSPLTFGSSERSRNYPYQTMQLKLESRFDPHEITMDALEVPEEYVVKTPAIGRDLLMQLHEHKMIVADELQLGDRPSQILSVVIRSDNYCRTVTGRMKCMSQDLCAVETVFGWLVQGIYQVDTANGLHHKNSTSALILSCERLAKPHHT
ncbi:hypothetical protein HPB51_019931 [Rhipicephalus microplus]|uniref:Peptidase aspartic putative domain-containing protein n=1 Tax=Rhipicephalus microplus TaxID=6941 RepID=A0A9J6E3M1_RHIMP|nr:hypothetical protein HPB51_019931 [Rhipicephalus microplus]